MFVILFFDRLRQFLFSTIVCDTKTEFSAETCYFFKNFNNTVSREEHKTIHSGLRIPGMALSNQSELPAFFSPQQDNLKISTRILPNPTMTYREWPHPGRWLKQNGQIPEDYLTRLPNPGLQQAKTGQAQEYKLLWAGVPACQFAKSQKRIWWNQQPKAIFKGRMIPACHKSDLIGIFKLTFL